VTFSTRKVRPGVAGAPGSRKSTVSPMAGKRQLGDEAHGDGRVGRWYWDGRRGRGRVTWARFSLANRGVGPDLREFDAAFGEDLGGEGLFLPKDAKQQVFGADVLVGEAFGLLGGVGEDALAVV